MNILAIETSCDETAVAILEARGGLHSADAESAKSLKKPSFSVLGDALYSQVALHAPYGGVFPNLAKREHQRNLVPLLIQAITESGFENLHNSSSNDTPLETKNLKLKTILDREPELLTQLEEFLPTIEKPPIDALAVTYGPGLAPALWVGVNFAKALSYVWNIPVIPVNHMEGHVVSALLKTNESKIIPPPNLPLQKGEEQRNQPITYHLQPITFPSLALLVSGGHTELVLMQDWGEYKLVGATRDDAAGEAFDKAARLMGLPYPGGPEISRLAGEVRLNSLKTHNYQLKTFSLPRPMLHSDNLDFSFSGLKTAVRREIEKMPIAQRDAAIPSLARECEEAIVDVLIAKTMRAIEQYGAQSIIVGGGVSANHHLRERMHATLLRDYPQVVAHFPIPELSTDNAIMIGVASALQYWIDPTIVDRDPGSLYADGNLRLATR